MKISYREAARVIRAVDKRLELRGFQRLQPAKMTRKEERRRRVSKYHKTVSFSPFHRISYRLLLESEVKTADVVWAVANWYWHATGRSNFSRCRAKVVSELACVELKRHKIEKNPVADGRQEVLLVRADELERVGSHWCEELRASANRKES